jgi:hypothetical protein
MKSTTTLLLAVALLGCNNDPAALTPNQYFQKRADLVCSAVASACLFPASTCVAGRVAEFTAEYQAALASFRDFIPGNADACLAKVKDVYGKIEQGVVALKAADYQAMQAICANVYRGASAALGPCALDADCLDNLICDKGYCTTGKTVAAGALCGNPGELCPSGFYCTNATGPSICTSKITLQGYCATSPCQENLRCLGGYCVARLDIGEPCASDGDCSGNFCEPYAKKCAEDIRFANGSAACIAMSN